MTRKATIKTLYDHPSDMEPLLATEGDSKATALALALIRGAERLRGSLHAPTRKVVADLLRSMNSYYWNLMEGLLTQPKEIEAPIRMYFSANADHWSLQIQH